MPFTKKKKNNFMNEDEAPIIKKKKPVPQAPVQEKKPKEKRVQIIQEQEPMGQFDQFLSRFSSKKNQTQQDKQDYNTNYPQIECEKKDKSFNSYENHFQSKSLQNYIKEKNQDQDSEIQQKLTQLLKQENQRNEEQVLNNNVSFKEFSIQRSYKKTNFFKTQTLPKLMLNQLAQLSIENQKLNETIKINQKQSIQDNYKSLPFTQKEKEIYRFIQDYYDFLYIDPQESQKESFRRLIIYHILNHFSAISPDQKNHVNILFRVIPNVRFQYSVPKSPSLYIDELLGFYTNGKSNRIINAEKFEEEYGDQEKGLDDNFKVGLSFKENMVKLYESFEQSDLIIASPLALKLHLEQQTHLAFLSSLDLLILDDAQKFYNQNWSNLESVIQNINQMPKHQDISQNFDLIRDYYFDNQQKFYRQTIVYSECNFPELLKMRDNYFENHQGLVQNKPFYQNQSEDLDLCIEYMKFDVQSLKDEIEKRFEYFLNNIWSKIMDDQNINQTAIVTNNYIEYVKLRNYFKKTNSFFTGICEYTPKKRVQQKVQAIMNHKLPFLLFNERAYYFNVCKLKKMKNIIFYSPPKNSEIYKEMLQNLQTSQGNHQKVQNRVACLFCNFDQMYIERLVGSKQSQEFFQEYNKSTTFII